MKLFRIAGITVRVEALYPETYGFLAGYELPREDLDSLAEDCVSACISRSDIAFERERSEAEDRVEGRPARLFSDAYMETLAVLRKLSEAAPFHDTALFHGSALAVDGEAVIFTAKSGTGKSTHAALWRQYLGSRVVMINDDKPFIRADRQILVCGSPWNGKHRLGCGMSAPLRAVCILERAAENSIRRISPGDAYPMLLQQVYRPADAPAMARTLGLIDKLAGSAAFYRLGCNMDIDAARTAYEVIYEA